MSRPHMTPLLELLLTWTLLTAAPGTVITYRAVVQPLYQWGLYGWNGTGVDSALWVPLATAVIPWTIYALAPPRSHIRIFSAALVTWHMGMFAMLSYASMTLGSRMTLRGDTFAQTGRLPPTSG